MDGSLWLVFDIGTSGVKAALIRGDGTIRATVVENFPTHSADGGVMEQNAGDWWTGIVTASQAFGDLRSDVGAICVTGQMQDLILLDGNGMPTGPVILYSDTRAKAEAADIIGKVGADRLLALTGNEQGADSLWAKLLWVRRHQPSRWEQARMLIFGAADYAAFRLTGEAVTDTTTASTTGLLDIRTRRWLEPSVLAEMDIDAMVPLLPAVVPGGAQIGILREDAARTLGILAGLPVYHAPGDAGSTTIGAGSGESGRAYGYLGTSGWVGFTADNPGAPAQGVFTLAHPREGQFMQVAPLLTAGGNLEWVRELFGQPDYTGVIGEAVARPISGVIYLPYLNGERAPFVDPLARAAFIGMSPGTTRADLTRAVLEGVAFAYRHALDTLMTEPLSRLILTGGGTRSGAWCQMFADILNVPIVLVEDAENVALRGAFVSAQVALGSRADYALAAADSDGAILAPNSALSATYARKYAVYRAAYPALKTLFSMG